MKDNDSYDHYWCCYMQWHVNTHSVAKIPLQLWFIMSCLNKPIKIHSARGKSKWTKTKTVMTWSKNLMSIHILPFQWFTNDKLMNRHVFNPLVVTRGSFYISLRSFLNLVPTSRMWSPSPELNWMPNTLRLLFITSQHFDYSPFCDAVVHIKGEWLTII